MRQIDLQLKEACARDNLNKVKELISHGADIECQYKWHWTPLMFAANTLGNNIEIVKYLISHGADINIQDDDGWTPLMVSSINDNLVVTKFLLSQRAKIELKDNEGRTCFTYHENDLWEQYSIQKLIMNNYPNGYSLLKNHNIQIHTRIKEEYPEESITDELGFFESFPVFKELEEDQEELNEDLFKSCETGDLEKVKELVEQGANIESKDESSRTPLFIACVNNNLNIVKFLVKNGVNIESENYEENVTSLMIASDEGYKNIVKYLIQQGADIKTLDKHGNNVIINNNKDNMRIYSSYDIQKLIINKYSDGYNFLKKNKVPIHPKIKQEYPESEISNELGFFENVSDHVGELINACKHGDIYTVRELTPGIVSVNQIDNFGYTPLIQASKNGHLEIVKYLISIGADINYKNYPYILSAIYYACVSKHMNVIKYLIDRGSEIDTECVMILVIYNEIDILQYLIYHGADINKVNTAGDAPLILECGRLDFHYSFESRKTMKFLILNGADIKIKDRFGKTCLKYKRVFLDYEIQKLLIMKHPSNMNTLIKNGIPIHKYIKQEYPEVSISNELGFF